ncbi:hypothetical protein ACFWTE_09340 [Nocardiopsis sp. NPDC058631]|uniref:hypothetical protein n=1 Tax=Nocardiopsis sp. NPDC058631 TaxID=3346566 RepID=UPI003667C842
MIYYLLFCGKVDPILLRRALSKVFGVAEASVDVASEDDIDSRNWDAAVSAGYSETMGDIDWSLSVYSAESVENQPTEKDLSLELARMLGGVVMFPGAEVAPSIWKLATSRGEIAYARVEEPEYEGQELRVVGVEIAVPELPRARVSRFPEVIKVLQLPTLIADSFISEDAEGAMREIRGLAMNWERLSVRMSSGWPPLSWYPASIYVEDLHCRDKADRIQRELSRDEAKLASELFGVLDSRYSDNTVEDGGHALVEAREVASDFLLACSWYWLRRPIDVPWVGGRFG